MALVDTYRVIDADTHIIEPTDLWTSRMSQKLGDRRPHVERHPSTGVLRWTVDGKWLNPVAYYNASGWPEYPPSHPPTLEASDPAGYDPYRRLAKMDEFGIYAQVIYPNIVGFDSHAFFRMSDQRLALECIRAYNDFLVDFAAANPNRLLPIAMLPFWDIEASVAEMHRSRDRGHRGILWAAKLHVLGFPRINSRHWDPLYAAAQDLGMPVNLHIGIGAYDEEDVAATRPDPGSKQHVGAYVVESAVSFSSNMHTIGTVLVSDVFERFPNLQMVSVESGFGYLPYLLESLDWQWKNAGGAESYPGRRLPSEKFFTNVYGTFWFERDTLRFLDLLPEYAERLMFETDFPHPTSLTPGPASSSLTPSALIERDFREISPDVTRKVLQDNASKLYGVAL